MGISKERRPRLLMDDLDLRGAAIGAFGGGGALGAAKLATETRNNGNTGDTLTDDADLQILAIPKGFYLFGAYIRVTTGTGTSPGMKYRFNAIPSFAAFNTVQYELERTINNNETDPRLSTSFTFANPGSTVVRAGGAFPLWPSNNSTGMFALKGYVEIVDNTNLILQWAQNVASAVNLGISQGSHISLLKVADKP